MRLAIDKAKPQASAGDPTPQFARLYTQTWSSEQDARVRLALAKLPAKEVKWFCCERVSVGPNSDDLRYFRKADEGKATEYGKLLADAGLPVRVSYITGFEDSKQIRPRHYELWLARPPKERSALAASTSSPIAPTSSPTPPIASSPPPVVDGNAQAPVITSIELSPSGVPSVFETMLALLEVNGNGFDKAGRLTMDGRTVTLVYARAGVVLSASRERYLSKLFAFVSRSALTEGTHQIALTNPDGARAEGTVTVGPSKPGS